MNKQTVIAVDRSGGDNAPGAIVSGCVSAVSEFSGLNLLLVGREEELKPLVGENPRIEIVNATQTISNDESPTEAFRRKKDSSVSVGLRLLREGKASAFVSAGPTGALLTGAAVMLERVPGVTRPALATVIPSKEGHFLLIDSGANVDPKPELLPQFAKMGAVYAEAVMGAIPARVGLINIGAEAEKGSALTKAAFELLSADSAINFVGNVEPRDIPGGVADVLVCDAFTGNVILKYSEGLAMSLFGAIKKELLGGFVTKLGAALARPAFKRLKKKFDYEEIGGAPFLGLKQIVVKAHGSSGEKAIKNAIRQALVYASSGGIDELAVRMGQANGI